MTDEKRQMRLMAALAIPGIIDLARVAKFHLRNLRDLDRSALNFRFATVET